MASYLKFGRVPVLVDLTEYGVDDDARGPIYVRGLSAGDSVVLAQLQEETGGKVWDHEVCFLGACTASGERYFTPEEAKDLGLLVARKISAAVFVASGTQPAAAEAAAKNSESSPP